MSKASVPVKSPCGAADLLAAILSRNPDEVRAKFGLPLQHPLPVLCPVCNKAIGQDGKCHQLHKVTMACDECSLLFERREKQVIWNSNYINPTTGRAYEHQFCTQQCLGRWLGKHRGFGAHPERASHSGRPGYRKWDEAMVWQKHLETGFGALKLSRLLNIPVGTITVILNRKRKEV